MTGQSAQTSAANVHFMCRNSGNGIADRLLQLLLQLLLSVLLVLLSLLVVLKVVVVCLVAATVVEIDVVKTAA